MRAKFRIYHLENRDSFDPNDINRHLVAKWELIWWKIGAELKGYPAECLMRIADEGDSFECRVNHAGCENRAGAL